jgi:hypothetical protein
MGIPENSKFAHENFTKFQVISQNSKLHTKIPQIPGHGQEIPGRLGNSRFVQQSRRYFTARRFTGGWVACGFGVVGVVSGALVRVAAVRSGGGGVGCVVRHVRTTTAPMRRLQPESYDERARTRRQKR